jgi:hypothetical protein
MACVSIKNITMATNDNGHPSGTNKSEGSGVPQNISPDDGLKTDRQTSEYTDERGELAESVRVGHPNRNVDKDHQNGPPYS